MVVDDVESGMSEEIENTKLYAQARIKFGTKEQLRNYLVLYARTAGYGTERLLHEFGVDDFEKENIAMRVHNRLRDGSFVEVALFCKTRRTVVFRYYPDMDHVIPVLGGPD